MGSILTSGVTLLMEQCETTTPNTVALALFIKKIIHQITIALNLSRPSKNKRLKPSLKSPYDYV
jgi:hypothetical protein